MSQNSPPRAPASTAMDANEKKILTLTSAAHYLTHFFVLVFPVLVMPISRDLSMEPAAVLTISFPMYLCYGLLAIPWGYLSDRIDARLMMGAGMIIAGVGFLAAGLAESVERRCLEPGPDPRASAHLATVCDTSSLFLRSAGCVTGSSTTSRIMKAALR